MKSVSLVATSLAAASLLMLLSPSASTQPPAPAPIPAVGSDVADGTADPLALVLINTHRMTAVQFDSGGPEDILHVAPTGIVFLSPVSMIQSFDIPDEPAFFGFEIYAQVLISDPLLFTEDPVRTSPLLVVRLGFPDLGVPMTPGSGLHIELAEPALIGGSFTLSCTF